MTAPSDIRFTVDHMLIKLGKYLRILGYDADWDTGIRTHELIGRANRDGRVFLTRNTRLPHQYPAPARALILDTRDPVEQLDAVAKAFSLDLEQRLFSRCVKCNVALDTVADKESIRPLVHANVFAQYRVFYRCPSCGTVFWKGSHVRNTCRKLGPAGIKAVS